MTYCRVVACVFTAKRATTQRMSAERRQGRVNDTYVLWHLRGDRGHGNPGTVAIRWLTARRPSLSDANVAAGTVTVACDERVNIRRARANQARNDRFGRLNAKTYVSLDKSCDPFRKSHPTILVAFRFECPFVSKIVSTWALFDLALTMENYKSLIS